jgi:ABC-type transport system substrate-binding protein
MPIDVFTAARFGHYTRENRGAMMLSEWIWSRKMLCLVLALLLMMLVIAQAPAATPASGTAKVDRLVMGLITPYLDYVRPWINAAADHNIQHDPMLEWLIEVDAETGQYVPWLADSWELGPERCGRP